MDHFISLSLISLSCILAPQDPPTISAILGKLDTQKQGVQSIYLESVCNVERGPATRARRHGDVHVRAWRDLAPAGRMRVEFNPEILGASDGSFIVDIKLTTFDGAITRHLDRSTGAEGRPRIPLNRGYFARERAPSLLWASEAMAWHATTLGVGHRKARSLADEIRRTQRRTQIRVSSTAELVSIRAGRDSSNFVEWTLDSSHGWALAAYRRVKKSIARREFVVEGFHQLTPTLFYPKLVTDTLRDARGVRLSCSRISCIEARAIAQPLAPERFRIDYPPMARVEDRISGKLIRVGHSNDELLAAIDAQLARIASPDSSPTVAVPRTLLAHPLFIAALVGIGLWLVLRQRKRRRSHRSRNLLLPVLVLGLLHSQESDAASDTLADRLGGERGYSCAVNVACYSLRALGIEAAPRAVAKSLGLPETWIGQIDLATIARTLRRNGLFADGYQCVDFSVLKRLLSSHPQSLMILHLRGNPGHFVVALKAERGMVLFLDVPWEETWIGDTRDSHLRFLGRLSGFGLLIERVEPVIEVDRVSGFQIYGEGQRPANSTSPGEQVTTLKRRVKNRLAAPLMIEQVRYSCDCLSNLHFASGGLVLGAMSEDDLLIDVTPNLLREGINRHRAHIVSRQGRGPARKLTATINYFLASSDAAPASTRQDSR